MPCYEFRDPKLGVRAIVCTPRSRGKKCFAEDCKGPAHWLCDFPVDGGKTCDRNICERHRRGMGPDKDYCLEHFFQNQSKVRA